MQHDLIPTATDLAAAIGRKRIAEALDVGPTAISNHVVRGKFPAAWQSVMRSLASEVGIPCPDHLFKMRGNPPTQPKEAAP